MRITQTDSPVDYTFSRYLPDVSQFKDSSFPVGFYLSFLTSRIWKQKRNICGTIRPRNPSECYSARISDDYFSYLVLDIFSRLIKDISTGVIFILNSCTGTVCLLFGGIRHIIIRTVTAIERQRYLRKYTDDIHCIKVHLTESDKQVLNRWDYN